MFLLTLPLLDIKKTTKNRKDASNTMPKGKVK